MFLALCPRLVSWAPQLRAQSQEHHTLNHLEVKGAKRGCARQFSLKGRERAIVNQTNTGTVSNETLGNGLF